MDTPKETVDNVGEEALQKEVNLERKTPPASTSTPTPLKRKRDASVESPQAVQLATSEPVATPKSSGKGLITTYDEWVKQSRAGSSAKSVGKPSASKLQPSKAKPVTSSPGAKNMKKKSASKGETIKATSAPSTPAAQSVKKKKPLKTTASKVRKIEELTEREKTQRASLDQLRRERTRLEKQMLVGEANKFPVSDERIVVADKKGGKPSPLPVPKNVFNCPPHLVPDLLMVWDFLYIFSKEIGLKTFELDDFLHSLKYQLDPSLIMVEICCALLRTILSDEIVSQRLEEELPKTLHFAHRGDLARSTTGFKDAKCQAASAAVHTPEIGEYAQLCPSFAAAVSKDDSCAALKLLNSRHPLRVSEIGPLTWQAFLRVILPRSDAFRDYQRSQDVDGDLAVSRYEGEGIDGEGHSTVNMDYKAHVLNKNAYTVHPHMSSLEFLNKLTAGKSAEVVKMEMGNEVRLLPYVDVCIDAVAALQEGEFHELPLEQKVMVLKLLVITCYDCETIQNKISSNAEERANQIQANSKLKLEEKRLFKEAANSMKEEAIARCRAINEGEEAEGAEVDGKKSVQKKLFKGKGGNGTAATSSSKKGNKNVKSTTAPSSAQLTAMLEEMVMLDAMGIDEVVPAAPELDEISDDEEENDDEVDSETKKLIDAFSTSGRPSRDRGSGAVAGAPRNQQKNARDGDRDRQRRRVERNGIIKAREIASSYIAQAVQSRRERDVKEAIKLSVAAGYKTVNNRGGVVITEELKKLYEVQYQLDSENKEAAQAQKLEKALSELFVRTEPIGQDRYFRSYWCFEGDDRLFVQTERESFDLIKLAVDNGLDVSKVMHDKKALASSNRPSKPSVSTTTKAASGSVDTDSETEEMVAELKKRAEDDLIDSSPLLREANRPSKREYTWSVFRSLSDLWQLVEALDERGLRERSLKNSIKARFDLTGEAPTPGVYLTDGSPYLGMKVKRTFGKGADKYVMIGIVTGWLPAITEGREKEPALWQISYADGDDEDIEEREVKKALIGIVPDNSPDVVHEPAEAEDMEVVDADGEEDKPLKVTRSVANPRVEVEQEKAVISDKEIMSMPFLLADDECTFVVNDLYVPPIVKNYSNSLRSGLAYKSHTIGYNGLRSEFLSLMNKLLEGLKNMGSAWTRSSSRRAWESSVRDAETVTEFKALLKELEGVVRETQVLEDTKQDEELENMRKKVRLELEAEGWVFSLSQLVDNESYASAVLDAAMKADSVAVEEGEKAQDDDKKSSNKRKHDELEKEDIHSNRQFKHGEIIHPSLPLLKANADIFMSQSALGAIDVDVQGVCMIGAKIRRFFRRTSPKPSDGDVVAFLPSFLNDGAPLWHVLHDDGDEEDLDHGEVIRGMRAFSNGLTEPEVEGEFDGEDEGSEDGGEAAPEEEVSEEEGSEDEFNDEPSGEGDHSKRLWSSAYVRARWHSAVSECKTMADVALAIGILSTQCSEYGVFAPDPMAMSSKRVSKPVNRLSSSSSHASKKRRFSLTPVKPKGSHRGANPIAGNGSSGTPSKMKKKKASSRKSMGGNAADQNHFNAFGFFPGDRPVRGSRREVCYAE